MEDYVPSDTDSHFAIENGPVKIGSVPINSMVMFNSYVTVYQRVDLHFPMVFVSRIPKLIINQQIMYPLVL